MSRTREERLEDVLDRLASEACKSVEYSDWPELQELVEEAREVINS